MSDVNSDNYRDEDLGRYEDNYSEQSNDDNRAGAGAAGAGSHAAATRAGGLPLRGLAMILIAVAVILALWAAYSMTKGHDSKKASATDTPSATAPQNAQPSQSGDAQPGRAAGNGSAAPSAAAGQNGAQPSNGNQAGQNGSAGAGAGAGAAAGAGQSGPTTLNVLNNSTVPGLADNVAKDYSARGQKVGAKGNLSGDTVTLPQTTVFYKEGDAAGQQAAAQLADKLAKANGVKVEAKPNIDQLPKDTTGPGQITLVLTGQVNVP